MTITVERLDEVVTALRTVLRVEARLPVKRYRGVSLVLRGHRPQSSG